MLENILWDTQKVGRRNGTHSGNRGDDSVEDFRKVVESEEEQLLALLEQGRVEEYVLSFVMQYFHYSKIEREYTWHELEILE